MNFRMYLHGEIDYGNRLSTIDVDLDRAIAESEAHVILDATDLTFIDSSGIQVIVAAQETLRAQGRELTIEHLSGAPQRIIETLGMNGRFTASPK